MYQVSGSSLSNACMIYVYVQILPYFGIITENDIR